MTHWNVRSHYHSYINGIRHTKRNTISLVCNCIFLRFHISNNYSEENYTNYSLVLTLSAVDGGVQLECSSLKYISKTNDRLIWRV